MEMEAAGVNRFDDPELAIYGVEEVAEPRTLVDIFEETVRNNPDAKALSGSNGSLTYRELAQRVQEQVHVLADSGIGVGD
ncbi:hypothetical protein, partial [Salmonella enterica]|uniref:hypothetical protein n=1 Tax=Salmonella enterica TaxID=28901 RepID=UPI0015CB2BD2